MIAAANSIDSTSYCYAGGHGSWKSSCYDCSGAVGFVLHAAGYLSSPEPSGSMESWGVAGRGRWVTVFANAGHAWMVIAGRAFDTAQWVRQHRRAPVHGGSTRPTPTRTSTTTPAADVARHPAGRATGPPDPVAPVARVT